MTAPAFRRLVQRITTVSRKVAQQEQTVRLGTVLSRNPDGSLNVEDGLGGCARVAPRANVRIGQKVAIGVEPGIGQQTNLATQFLTIEPSSVPCPTDDRGGPTGCIPRIGVPCGEEVFLPFEKSANVIAFYYSTCFEFDLYPGINGVWSDRLFGGLVEGTFPCVVGEGWLSPDENGVAQSLSSRRNASYPLPDPVDDPDANHDNAPYADQYGFTAGRSFLQFDTSTIPLSVQFSSVKLQLNFLGNDLTVMKADTDASIYIVPASTDDDPENVANYYAWTPKILAQARIADIIAAGPDPVAFTPFTFELDLVDPDTGLPPDAGIIQRVGKSRFAIITSADFDEDSDYPIPDSYTDLGDPSSRHVIQDFVRLSYADPILRIGYLTGTAS